MSAPITLSTLAARRIALGAQGFTRARPDGPVTGRHLRSTLRRLGFFQIDSVNVLARAHLMPLYSRRGPYDLDVFHRAYGRAPRAMFEYWAHVATFVDVDLWPAMAHRMRETDRVWGGPRRVAAEQPRLVEAVHAYVAAAGPVTARAVDAALGGSARDRSHWGWNWSDVKSALEYLFFTGALTSARRNAQFEREYDLPERVIPAEVLARPALEADEAHRVLVEHAARAHGVGTEPCLRDYFRTAPGPTQRAVAELADAGVLLPAQVAGWERPAHLHHEAARPRRVEACALLSPFDPVVFERTRAERLFGFRYRIEIYVPEPRREYGYYVLPFLLGDALVARVDLKADRLGGRLLVQGAWAEADAPAHTADALAAELGRLAGWLGLADVTVAERGDLAGALARALRPRASGAGS